MRSFFCCPCKYVRAKYDTLRMMGSSIERIACIQEKKVEEEYTYRKNTIHDMTNLELSSSLLEEYLACLSTRYHRV
jgi:hypothetical protein